MAKSGITISDKVIVLHQKSLFHQQKNWLLGIQLKCKSPNQFPNTS